MCSEVSGGLCIYRKGFHVDEASAIPDHFYCQSKLFCRLRINRRRSQSDSQAIGVSRLGKAERALLTSQTQRGVII